MHVNTDDINAALKDIFDGPQLECTDALLR